MPGAFYERDGDLLVATELTRGPWDPEAQHAGPLAALFGRAIEALPDAGEYELGRITFEILGPVPIAPVAVSAAVARPGRRVQMVEAELSAEGEVRMRARAWRLRTAQLELPEEAIVEPAPPPGPEQAAEMEFFDTGQDHGYHTAMEYRSISGSFLVPGPAVAWLRMLKPLVAGEEPSALQRLLIAADVGNGISASLDYTRFVFINVDLSIHLERLPVGEWICIDAVTLPRPTGRGSSDAILFDRDGRLGRAMQTLFIAER